jgi:hypothetical protein
MSNATSVVPARPVVLDWRYGIIGQLALREG